MAVRSSGCVCEGQRVAIECEFRVGGILIDPLVVQCTIRPPGGGQTTLNYPNDALIRTGAGLYEADVTLDAGGTWWFRFSGHGNVDAVSETYVNVAPTNMVSTTSMGMVAP